VLASFRTAAVFGVDACPVHVEVDVSFGLPSFAVVGLPDTSVRESKDRVRSAIRNSGFEFPPHRITVNLAPADLRKAGAAFDLPIALGILAASGVVERRHVADLVLVGELSLDGSIHPTRGVLPIAAAARRDGVSAILLPAGNAREARLVAGLTVVSVASLGDAVQALNDPGGFDGHVSAPAELPAAAIGESDLADVHGQLLARRALEIAAAGGHNVLLVGPPGAGKTMMARRIAGILPPLTFDEALEVTAVHSVAGVLRPGAGLITERPFRAPHHTISEPALVGGGSQPRPGEVSLAHHGVLFLDEMLEFSRRVLEVLRQPLEEGSVVIARAARTVVFPARFTLAAATNPCPCGFAGDPVRACRCTPMQVAKYHARLSGPLRDRLDLTVDVPAVPPDVLGSAVPGESSAAVRARVVAARARQQDRYTGEGVVTNARLTPAALRRHCALSPPAARLLSAAVTRMSLSARGYDRVRKVARTIADLVGEDHIAPEHIAEALQFRMTT
jgi:magnesium chelatase family protein